MKIIRTSIIPFPTFRAANLFGVLFVRGSGIISKKTMNHESIHSEQWRELLYIGFLLWYLIEWIIRLFAFKGTKFAYRNISFEREAHTNQSDLSYLKNRKRFDFAKYIKKTRV